MDKLPLTPDPPTSSRTQAIENKGNGRIWEQWEGSLQPQHGVRAGAHMEGTDNPPDPPISSQSQTRQEVSDWEVRFRRSHTLTVDLVEDLLEQIEGEELHLVLEIVADFADELLSGILRVRQMDLD